MVDVRTLATMRAAVAAYLLDAVEIGTVTVSHDRYGHETEMFTGAASPAQLRDPSASEQRQIEPLRDAGYLGTETLILTVPHGTALASHVRTADGAIWRVVQVATPRALATHHEAVITREVPR